MSIETTLTLVLAAAILVAAIALRVVFHGIARLALVLLQWVRPTPEHAASARNRTAVPRAT